MTKFPNELPELACKIPGIGITRLASFVHLMYPLLLPTRIPFRGDQSKNFDISSLPEEIVIYKPSYGAFYDTPLETALKNLGKDTVIICGTLTNYYCGTTTR